MSEKDLETQAYKLFLSGDLEGAEAHYREALQQKNNIELLINLGSVLCCNQRAKEAIQCFREALKLNPQHAEARTFLGIALLLSGDFGAGWREYEARIRSNQFKDFLNPLGKFAWTGGAIEGKTILVRSEQGAGDNIQFCRFLKKLKNDYKCKVVLHCRPDLKSLFESCQGIDQIISAEGETVENCAACVYLGSLPGIFQITQETIPGETPYLKPSEDREQKWNYYFNSLDIPQGKLKVGIANKGNPKNPLNRFRELPIKDLQTLLGLENCFFFGIQKDNQDFTEIKASNFIDLSGDLQDFDDTAAIIQNLDFVISVDTSVIHLAGALNKKGFLLLSRACDWRWMLERKDSLWYPSLTIFRQEKLFDWTRVLEEIREELFQKFKLT
ncbi:MAG: tetratricopeptide repeat protein [Candidatus Caenarcaniphilales bacterium]|nr:tetratricopeptide repeat protein [Candidatus Caenarcaniphilales bacterium]